MSENVLDDLRAQFDRVNTRLTSIEDRLSELTARTGALEVQSASLSVRMDRIGGDVEMIKRRLDLVDA